MEKKKGENREIGYRYACGRYKNVGEKKVRLSQVENLVYPLSESEKNVRNTLPYE